MKRLLVPMLAMALAAPLAGTFAAPGAVSEIDPNAYQATVTNSLFPLASVNARVYEGQEVDAESGEIIRTRVVEQLLPETTTVAGVEVSVVEVKEYEDGVIIERTLDYYAQDLSGTVYYFGEDVDKYEDEEDVSGANNEDDADETSESSGSEDEGDTAESTDSEEGDEDETPVVANHDGAWHAGEGDALPGLFMPVAPQVGDVFEQERAPGIAEDKSTVVAIGLVTSTPAGDFTDCIKTDDVNPLDGHMESKTYCAGVGLVREEADGSLLELVSYGTNENGTPAA